MEDVTLRSRLLVLRIVSKLQTIMPTDGRIPLQSFDSASVYIKGPVKNLRLLTASNKVNSMLHTPVSTCYETMKFFL